MTLDQEIMHSLSNLLPLQIQSYLIENKWKQISSIDKKATIWEIQTPDLKRIQAVLPMDTGLRDYSLRIFELLQAIKITEQRPILSILNDLQEQSDDTLRLTIAQDDAEGLRYTTATTLLKRSLDIVCAAANAEVKPQSYYRSRHPKIVQDYIDSLKLGHTERGSFILKIMSPVAPSLTIDPEKERYEEDPPFSRKVFYRLATMLDKAVSAASQGNANAFTEAVKYGISANFCDALADLVISSGCSAVDINLSWAPTRKPSRHPCSRFQVRRDIADVLTTASKYLRERVPEQGVEIIGYVIQLKRESEDYPGTVVVVDMSEDQKRNVSLELKDEDYQKAYRAHSGGLEISALGDLEVKLNRWYLTKVLRFEIVDRD